MFSFLRKESPQLQLYGKLPLAKDYLRIGCSEGNARAFRDWLDQSFSVKTDAGSAPILAWPARFVFATGMSAPVLGCAWASSDEGGLRKFPLALMVERKERALIEALTEDLPVIEGWWRKLEALHAGFSSHADGHALLSAQRGRVIEPESIQPAPVVNVEFERWLSALWPGASLEGLQEALATLERLSHDRYAGPIRMPLVGDLPLLPQVQAWRTALVDLKVLRPDDLPTLFYPQADTLEEPAFLALFRAGLRPADTTWLTAIRTGAGKQDGDLCDGSVRRAGESTVDREQTASLSASVHGAVLSFHSRYA